jgi:prepilin-type N-terminal cleavage/methylation domain-containing protein
MQMKFRSPAKPSPGFTLIELMVAITLGLIVIGSLVAFTVSTVRANNENVRMTRLTQDLRTSMNLAVREVRRSGYDATSVTRALTTEDPSNFLDLTVDEDTDCVTYTYDRDETTTESRGFKLNTGTGALQMKVSDTTVDCDSAAGWEDISDPNVVEITKFKPRLIETRFCGELGTYPDPADATKELAILARGAVRTLAVCVKGNLRADASISRYVTDVIRLRAEGLDFNTTEPPTTKCTADESATYDPAAGAAYDAASARSIDVIKWNQECAG